MEEVHEVGELDKVENNNLEEDIGKFRILRLREKTLTHDPITPSPIRPLPSKSNTKTEKIYIYTYMVKDK